MSDRTKISISKDECNSPEVEQVLKQQASLSGGVSSGRATRTTEIDFLPNIIHKSWFSLMLAGLIGALVGWGLIEPHLNDFDIYDVRSVERTYFFLAMLFPTVGGFIGFTIGGVEGILARNYWRAFRGSVIGFGVGFGGGLVSMVVAGAIYFIVALLGWGILQLGSPYGSLDGFIVQVVGRSLAWTVAGMTVGLGPGIALKSARLTLNGFLGGMLGGLIGGLLFDPINYVVSGGTLETGIGVSRAISLGIIGATAGFMIGLVETLTKEAWLLMIQGPLKGKQFIVYKNPTRIGSSPANEIYLFKDPAIDPFHAAVHILREGYELEDRQSGSGTFVNGQRITDVKRLRNGDVIQIGQAKFIYSEKEKKRLKNNLRR